MCLLYLARLFLGCFFAKSSAMLQSGILTCYFITLIGFDSDHTIGARHLQCGVGSVDDRHELQEERPLEDAVVPDVKASYLERQCLLTLVVPCSIGHLQVDASDRCGQLPWDDPVKRILHRGQVLQIEAHLNEGFLHNKIQ
jgi:hypothetical protein